MKHSILLLVLLLLGSSVVRAQSSIYEQAINDIDNNAIHLTDYVGKKILFVVLPLSASDTSVQQQLLRFQSRYDSSHVQVIGLVAIEEGYSNDRKDSIQQQYTENIHAGLIITQGISVRKSAGSNQAALLRWLTNKDSNGHFDQDADETGRKFFVGGNGRLFAVLGAATSLDSRIADKAASTE